MNQVKEIRDLEVLTNIKEVIKTAEDISKILSCIPEVVDNQAEIHPEN